jgi:hypothetical protein
VEETMLQEQQDGILTKKAEDFNSMLNLKIKKLVQDLSLLKEEHLPKDRFKTMSCTIGTILQTSSMSCPFT